jgi:hypothetical protein
MYFVEFLNVTHNCPQGLFSARMYLKQLDARTFSRIEVSCVSHILYEHNVLVTHRNRL